MREVQNTILICQVCGFRYTIVPLDEGVNYYELTDIRDKGVSVDFFFKDKKRLKCHNCENKDFSVFYELIKVE